jgi:tetratricopeptide (TPR) repeat protein/SAM-dependent methyltransferase
MMTESVATLMQQAMAHHSRGELEDASSLYDQVLDRESEHPDALHLTGVVAHQQGRNEDAVALITRAIANNPSAPGFRNNLGMALTALGRTAQAEDAYQEALARVPDFADALLNLGNLRGGQGRFEEAVTLLERAIAKDASVPEAHYNLGCARFALGNPRAALDALQRAMDLGADFADAHYKIGSVHAALGEMEQAIAAYGRALDRDGDHPGARDALLAYLDTLSVGVDAARLEAVLAPLLRAESVNPRRLGHAAGRLLEAKHRIGTDDGSQASPQHRCDRLLDDEVARLYLRHTINVSAPLERLLTGCRARWVAEEIEAATMAQARWDAVAAVAIQCFLNEFVWAVTLEEERAVDVIEKRIVTACASQVSPDETLASDLLVYACYRPLWQIVCAARLGAAPAHAWPAALGEVLRICLHEPLYEHGLRARIASGSAIRDDVSKAVQAQYEENPYPRWRAVTRGVVQDIEQRVQRWCPEYTAPAELGGPLRVLVAGCGTGMDAIDTALHLNNVQVTAIDLSRASLAFGMRKAEEYALENLRFQHQDILELEGSGDRYHVIISNGVLHHMQDPGAGLGRLVELLIPQGLIKLALYSRLARGPLLEAGERIRASGFAPRKSDIRAFRQRVLEEGPHGPLAELTGSTDFYSASDCRDLLFHVHEEQMTLPGIRSLLEDKGLAFLGFELTISEVEQGFQREHPDAALTDLEAWAAYEQRHPESFRAMYHFWCRKR